MYAIFLLDIRTLFPDVIIIQSVPQSVLTAKDAWQ